MPRKTLLAVLVAVLVPVAAHAGSFTAYGPHLGFSSTPDQVVLGGHLQWGDVAPQLDFVPSVDLGFGDHATLVSLNGDFHYRIPTRTQWQPYVGGGVALEFVSVDVGGSGFADANSTFAGGNLIVGADVATKSSSRFFAELKLGIGDVPDFKLMAGWSFWPH